MNSVNPETNTSPVNRAARCSPLLNPAHPQTNASLVNRAAQGYTCQICEKNTRCPSEFVFTCTGRMVQTKFVANHWVATKSSQWTEVTRYMCGKLITTKDFEVLAEDSDVQCVMPYSRRQELWLLTGIVMVIISPYRMHVCIGLCASIYRSVCKFFSSLQDS